MLKFLMFEVLMFEVLMLKFLMLKFLMLKFLMLKFYCCSLNVVGDFTRLDLTLKLIIFLSSLCLFLFCCKLE